MITFAVGCGRPSAGPSLRFVDIVVDEDDHPASVAVIVDNAGDSPARLQSAKANVGWNYLIAGQVPTDQLPARLEHELKPMAAPPISPGGRQTCTFDFVWTTAPDAPPMLALVHATLTLEFETGQPIETAPVTFVIRSRPEIAVRQPAAQADQTLSEQFDALPGWKSPYARELARTPNLK